MTRETKIGLLVGLAFIIVIGILLSDHLTSSTEPPQATLANAGNNVRSAVTTPGSGSTTVTPLVQPAPVTLSSTVPPRGSGSTPATPLVQPAPVTPSSTVPTQNELTPKNSPVQILNVGIGNPSANKAGHTGPQQSPTVATNDPSNPVIDTAPPT